jgi:carboxylesterase
MRGGYLYLFIAIPLIALAWLSGRPRGATLVLAALLIPLAWLLRPPPPMAGATTIPSASYAESVARIAALRTLDSVALYPGCGTEALLHGRRAPRAIVLFHGITNCPLQFHALAMRLYEGGDNVLVPRVRHHGLRDPMTSQLARLTAGDLTWLATECVGIARGLGDTVVVAGLSSGGVMAAWAAQGIEGVDRAVVIAPAFAPPFLPGRLEPIATRIALHVPNLFVWWDDKLREKSPGPPQCYPRFATRAMAETYRLGEVARAGSPRTRDLAMLLSRADEAIDNARADTLAARWRRVGARVREVVFPRSLGVTHDMIDPQQVGAKVDIVYPPLVSLIRGESLPRGW